VTDGAQALRAIEKNLLNHIQKETPLFKLIILDYNMPEMLGLEVVK
jgi:CheY-like chemotaxis protein